nr:integrase, catalytic region, zinc finger, CCHC-type, peptidase aspartic, catalytic [Tanacetum cinerariifolium]
VTLDWLSLPSISITSCVLSSLISCNNITPSIVSLNPVPSPLNILNHNPAILYCSLISCVRGGWYVTGGMYEDCGGTDDDEDYGGTDDDDEGGKTNTFDDDVNEGPVQDMAQNEDNIFQANQCDAFDSDVDEAPTAQTMFMANLLYAAPAYDEAGPSYD